MAIRMNTVNLERAELSAVDEQHVKGAADEQDVDDDDAASEQSTQHTTVKISFTKICNNIFEFGFWFLDFIVLFRMGRAYLRRFEDFLRCTDPAHGTKYDKEVAEMRVAQVAEWTTLSVTVSVLSAACASRPPPNKLVCILSSSRCSLQ